MAKLYIVATPIGNLKDITLRALEVLQYVDYIAAEDTRVTKKLLAYYRITHRPLLSYHHHSGVAKTAKIVELLKRGNSIALVSDAGTPGINDPGGKLVERALQDAGNVEVIPIPGPSALTAMLSISGINADRFLFLGFPPRKNRRRKFFQMIEESEYPVVFYESKHRIIKTLKELSQFESIKKRPIMVAQELTKMHETLYRGTVGDTLNKLIGSGGAIKGEFVILLA